MTVPTILNEPALLEIARAATATVMELPPDELRADSSFAGDVDADSLAMIEIVEVAEELLLAAGVRLRVDDATLAGLKTLSDLVKALQFSGAAQRGVGHDGASS